ncbi:hypothetical protein EDD27_6640 [Nonomuraea polychroma]|uniref:Carboxymuconolactone decarboxylase family protein n=1 Tax=Nonomuraea polychroma TaxID=46176 RepID=A0A438MDP6_9ACTN|nr:hypothetical protein EDD27_6640 [Nonomuraea polychroma]
MSRSAGCSCRPRRSPPRRGEAGAAQKGLLAWRGRAQRAQGAVPDDLRQSEAVAAQEIEMLKSQRGQPSDVGGYLLSCGADFVQRASRVDGIPEDADVGDEPQDEALEAARRLTQAMVTQRGWVDDAEIEAFLAAGYTRRHVLDIVLGVGMRTLSNYSNHIGHPAGPGLAGPGMDPRVGPFAGVSVQTR